MTTITQQLAEALRDAILCVAPDQNPETFKCAREALAAYDAQQTTTLYQRARELLNQHSRTYVQGIDHTVSVNDALRVIVAALSTAQPTQQAIDLRNPTGAAAALEHAPTSILSEREVRMTEFRSGHAEWCSAKEGAGCSCDYAPEKKGFTHSAAAAPAASGGEDRLTRAEAIAEFRSRTGASVSEWAREILSLHASINVDQVTTVQALAALEQALTQQRGAATECVCPAGSGCTNQCNRGWRRILSEARALPPSSRDNVLDFIEREMEQATNSHPNEALRLRYFADGPQGSFFTNNLQLARDLVNLYDKDDDWTITDLENPYGPSNNGS